ncbi:hypothetical protein [Radicibacter daui]|uniref:hypothetical protein n=1 Tax=Radicibacter daui TaxID=3064829 RepID=UPI004046F271
MSGFDAPGGTSVPGAMRSAYDAHIENLVADAIRSADNSWFREDYTEQATKVMQVLRRKGFHLVPQKLSDRAVEKAVEDMPYGRLNPADYVRQVYKLMIAKSLRY